MYIVPNTRRKTGRSRPNTGTRASPREWSKEMYAHNHANIWFSFPWWRNALGCVGVHVTLIGTDLHQNDNNTGALYLASPPCLGVYIALLCEWGGNRNNYLSSINTSPNLRARAHSRPVNVRTNPEQIADIHITNCRNCTNLILGE